jgi:phage shock protein PspC (stress-responsive transcriptional regulator)
MTERFDDRPYRGTPDQPLLAGVCAWLAWRLGWSTWGLRLGILIIAWLMPFKTLIVYALIALVLGLQKDQQPPSSPISRRLDEIERRMRKL